LPFFVKIFLIKRKKKKITQRPYLLSNKIALSSLSFYPAPIGKFLGGYCRLFLTGAPDHRGVMSSKAQSSLEDLLLAFQL
jgi:hypothetical protein